MIKAILFDLDNTLIDRDEAFRRILEQDITDSGQRLHLLDLDNHGLGQRSLLFEAWNAAASAVEPMNQSLLVAKICQQLQPDRGLLALLADLKIRVAIGIVTNGGSQSQRQKILAAGLQSVMEPNLFISGELKLEKPNPEIFRKACHHMACLPHETLYIGDRDEIDGIGSRSAGLHFQLVERPLGSESLSQIVEYWRTA